jgi:hypothetical protein
MRIIISPYSQKLPKETFKNDVNPSMVNPKNYPYWEELITILKNEVPNLDVVQIGVAGEKILKGVTTIKHNLSPQDLLELAKTGNAWFAVDNFFNHFCSYYNIPNGFVMFGQSDPNIYGYKQNTNILKDRKYLRPDQFGFWWDRPYIKEAFLEPEEVAKLVLPVLKVS